MPTFRMRWFAAALALLVVALPAVAAERSAIADKYKWNLTDLYPDEASWQKSLADLRRRVTELEKHKGHLGDSPAAFYEALSGMMDFARDYQRLATWASQKSDEDTRDSHQMELDQTAGQLGVDFGAAVAYVRPEILGLGSAKVHEFMAAEPRLAPYQPYLDDLLRYEAHTLTPGEEKISAMAGRMAGAGSTIRGILNNAEMPWPTITLSTGEKVRLDDAAYTQYRQSSVRADRDSVFRVFWRAHRDFRATYGATLNAGVQGHLFNKDVHKYNSCVEAALFGNNIPVQVYKQLVSDVNANLPVLHRYLKLRQRMMGVDQLRYEDLYAPLVNEVETKYTPEQAMEMTLAAVKPLGQAYVDTLGWGMTHGWVDWFPSPGKRSGAYSTGAYGVHPYQLQNFTGLYDEVGTLAHESGHSMHTFYASKKQPFVTADYATFVAEVASTLNENLLFHYMLDRTTDKSARLSLLGSRLEDLRGTMFRQAMLAEFELAIHEMAERGEQLSGDNMSKVYLDIARRYYGHDQGVCKVDDLYGIEWTYIPHFFYNFYVYQYATSIIASTSIADGIRHEAGLDLPMNKRPKKAPTVKRDAYLNMLASGSSRYPIDLLKATGVDMTTSAPFNAAMKEMNAVMDEMEKLLK